MPTEEEMMMLMMIAKESRGLALSVGLLTVAGCMDSPAAPVEPSHATMAAASAQEPTADARRTMPHGLQQWVADLRGETRALRNFEAAAAEGYVAQLSPCVDSPAGGMGYHFGNPALIDGRLDALRPEVVLYEPRRGGGMRFVGVEFIVPFAAWNESEAPQVEGFELHRNEDLGLWVLHVWTQRRNPAGTLTDFNPRVSCQFAPERNAAE